MLKNYPGQVLVTLTMGLSTLFAGATIFLPCIIIAFILVIPLWIAKSFSD
jgi:hypothetical protein